MPSTKFAVFSVGPVIGQPIVVKDGIEYVSQYATAFEGRCRVICRADDFFGGAESRPYRSRVLTNPTWLKLLFELDRQIKVTGDQHHVFLEGVHLAKQQPEPGVTWLVLETGS